MTLFSRHASYLLSLFAVVALLSCGQLSHSGSSSDHSRKGTYTLARASYDLSLISVEKPVKAKEKYGEPTIGEIRKDKISKYYFEDGMVRIEWRPTSLDIAFLLNNKLDDSINIIWDEAKFFDEEGYAHGVIHSGISYDERYHSRPPAAIAKKGSLKDFIYPADYLQKAENYTSKSRTRAGEWDKRPILPAQIRATADELKAKTEPLVGKTLQVLLPLQVENVRYDYLFTFKINKVNVTEEKHEQEKSSEDKGREGRGRRSGRGMRF